VFFFEKKNQKTFALAVPSLGSDRPPSMTYRLYQSFVTQAEIDAQYNAAQCVADSASESRHFVTRSAQARQTLRCVLDVPFGPTLAETLDIFPADRPDAPVFIFLHGGYWRALSSKEFSCVAVGPQQLGITTVLVNYALCPGVTIDEITRQVRGAVAWVLRNIAGHGGNPACVALGGHSAGGHLVAMCLQTDWQEIYGLPETPLRAAMLLSGLYDLEPLRYSYLQPQIQLDDGIIRRNSPAFSVRRCATPALITWGEAETAEFVRQSAVFHQAWQGVGNDSELRPQPGANHYSVIHGLEDPASNLCQWLASKLAPADDCA
jgi:arylformamidase